MSFSGCMGPSLMFRCWWLVRDGAGTAQVLSLLMTDPFDNALIAPAVARNRDPILTVLREVLPAAGTVLEIASGTGEHAVHFAAALPHIVWQASDPDEKARLSIAAHASIAGLVNVRSPLALD